MTPSRFLWGIMFVAIGVALLLTNADVLGNDYWWELLSWWPVILIAIGLEKIFLRSKLRLISYIAPLLMVATMAYVGFTTEGDYYDGGTFSSMHWSEKSDSSIHTIEAVIDHGRTDIRVGQSRYNLISARVDRFTRKPRFDFSKADGIATLDVSRRLGGPGGFIVIGGRRISRDWQFSFTESAGLKLTCVGDDSEVDLNLQSVPLEDLSIENDDGDIYLKIGNLRPSVNIEVMGDDAALRFRVPDGVGLKATGETFDGYFKSLGLLDEGDYFISQDFDSSTIKVNLSLDDNLRSLSIDYY